MTEDRTPTFSQQQGYEPLPGPLRLREFPIEARTTIWNILFELMQSTRHVAVYGSGNVGGVWKEILWAKHVHFDYLPLDECTDGFDAKCTELKRRIRQDPFNKVFDLIQFMMRHPSCPPEFINGVSWVFRRFQLAYTVDTNPPVTIVPAATAEEGEQLTRNLAELRAAELDGCTTHLRNASKCINDGDSSGSVRESIHAVESVARQIDPEASKTLGPALASLEKRNALHPTLKVAFNNLYGYTNREQGIRHALLDNAQANVTIDEAVFMLGACASFASYLWRKHKAANAP